MAGRRISLLGWGSRGDVQPIVALAAGLRDAGHRVRVVVPLDFVGLAEEHRLDVEPFPISMADAIASEQGRAWLTGSRGNPLVEWRAMRAVVRTFAEPAASGMERLVRGSRDALVSGVLTRDAATGLAHAAGVPHAIAYLAPLLPSASADVQFGPAVPGRSPINRASGALLEASLWWTFRPATDLGLARAGLPRLTWRNRRAWSRDTPILLGASPRVVPTPPDWPRHVTVTGWWRLPEAPADPPPPRLRAFLDAGEPPVYVGFGSMPVADPAALWDAVTGALADAGRRGVLLAPPGSWRPASVPDHVHAVGHVPHDWLFPRTAGVVHHGGSGTTGAAFAAGVPQLVVPHMGDQPYWGRRVRDLGVGPAPVPLHRLTRRTLAPAIARLTADGRLRDRAAALGEEVRAEDGVAVAVRTLEEAFSL